MWQRRASGCALDTSICVFDGELRCVWRMRGVHKRFSERCLERGKKRVALLCCAMPGIRVSNLDVDNMFAQLAVDAAGNSEASRAVRYALKRAAKFVGERRTKRARCSLNKKLSASPSIALQQNLT